MNRKEFLRIGILSLLALPFLGIFSRKRSSGTLWQIDPSKCTQCGKCESLCVLHESAVKCVHQYASCGYCDFCSGYYQDNRTKFDTAAENQRCQTGAIQRTFIEDPYFEYTIDESRCTGCGKCVKGCADFGNGSLFLQVRHDRCKNCGDCPIARQCPAQAFQKVPADEPYLFKHPPEEKV